MLGTGKLIAAGVFLAAIFGAGYIFIETTKQNGRLEVELDLALSNEVAMEVLRDKEKEIADIFRRESEDMAEAAAIREKAMDYLLANNAALNAELRDDIAQFNGEPESDVRGLPEAADNAAPFGPPSICMDSDNAKRFIRLSHACGVLGAWAAKHRGE